MSETSPNQFSLPERDGGGLRVNFIGTFNTPETPFNVEVDSRVLSMLLTEGFGMKPEDVSRLRLQIVASDVPAHEVIGHPVKKLQTLLYPNKKILEGLVNEEVAGGTRTVTLFSGNVLRLMEEDCKGAITRYYKSPSPENVERVQEQFPLKATKKPHFEGEFKFLEGYNFVVGTDSSRRLENYLKSAPPERAKEFILYLSRVAAGKRMQGIIAKNFAYVKERPQNLRAMITKIITHDAPLLGGTYVLLALMAKLGPMEFLTGKDKVAMVLIALSLGKLTEFLTGLEMQKYEASRFWRKLGNKTELAGQLANAVRINFNQDLLDQYLAVKHE